MKKIYLCAFALILFNTAYSQVEYLAGVNGSLRFPFIINQNAYGNQELEYELTTGYGGGLKGGVLFNEGMVGILLEANYGRYGQNYVGTAILNEIEYPINRDISLDYIEFPLMVRFVAGHGYNLGTFYGQAGVQYMLLQRSEITYSYDGQSLSPFPTHLETDDHKTAFQSSDIGLCFDLGYLKSFGKKKNMEFTVGIRGYYGFTDINAAAYRLPNSKGDYEKSTNTFGSLQLSWAYIFGRNGD